MTALRPLVIPAAAIVLAAGTSSADARTRRPVGSVWVTSPGPTLQAAVGEHASTHATPVHAAITLPPAAGTTHGQVAVPGGHYAAATELTGAVAAGRPPAATARGPPR